jgi:hypothetical protein
MGPTAILEVSVADFYYGVVENIDDPLGAGRVKVRVHGIHPMSKQQTPTEDLPWASPLHPTTSPAKAGVGFGGVGVVVGSDVMVVFRDQGHFQQPIILGTLPGLHAGEEGSSIQAAKDGTPRESDLGRLATGNLTDKTIIKTKNDSVTKTEGDLVISEPKSPYAAKYPANKTYVTPGGHVIELDDTAGAERIHIYHKSGSFSEIHPDGTNVVRTVGNTYSINKQTLNVTVGTDENVHVGGNSNEFVGGNEVVNIGGNQTETVKGNVSITVNGTTNVKSNGTMNIESGADIHMKSGGSFTVNAGGDITMNGSTINLN